MAKDDEEEKERRNGKAENEEREENDDEDEEEEEEEWRGWERAGALYRGGFEDGPLFLRAWPVSRLMNCIIGNPEYKLGFAITSPNG